MPSTSSARISPEVAMTSLPCFLRPGACNDRRMD
jgi:hypothetical protein